MWKWLLLGNCLWTTAHGQAAPQFVWEGQVDGIAVVHVRGRVVDVETRQGSPVERQRFRFLTRLPDSRQSVELRVVEGRGSVRIVQQPRLENEYTVSVIIEDRQEGPAYYSFELKWASDRGSFSDDPRPWQTGSGRDRLTWSGRVDGEVVVRCRRGRCETATVTGQPVGREKFRFTRDLPAGEIRVSLDETSGRGDTRLLEQPSAHNGYAAVVRIRDHQGGAADYSFVLSWPRSRPQYPEQLSIQPGLDEDIALSELAIATRLAGSEVGSNAPIRVGGHGLKSRGRNQAVWPPEFYALPGPGKRELSSFQRTANDSGAYLKLETFRPARNSIC